MTPQEARIIVLENALRQAYHTTSFLHGCLTKKKVYKYSYPEQTEKHLKNWESLVDTDIGCLHSYQKENCESCAKRLDHSIKLNEANMILNKIVGE